MRNISFFYTKGGSAYIRGEQIGKYLGAKHNPVSGYEDDVCIYVKIIPPENRPKHTWCDVDDSWRAVEWLKTHRDTGIIAISLSAKDYMQQVLNRDDIVFIPHQHINFERWVRPDREVKNVGIIGSVTSFQYPIEDIREKLRDIGLELFYEKEYWETYKSTSDREMRLNVVDFHKKIDIQIVWRPRGFYKLHDPLRNPNKLGNASSFGIPTVSYPEKNYIQEWGDCFITADSIDKLVDECRELKENKEYYRYYSEKALERAEDYHVEKIAELYRQLQEV